MLLADRSDTDSGDNGELENELIEAVLDEEELAGMDASLIFVDEKGEGIYFKHSFQCC